MTQLANKIGNAFGNMMRKEHGILSGTIQDVDENNASTSVVLTGDDPESPTEEVLLNVILQNVEGLLLIPKKGADCIVASIDGPGIYHVLHASKYDSVKLTVGDRTLEGKEGQWTFDGGNNGTVPISSKVVARLNKIENLLNNLKTSVTAVVIAGTLADGASVKAGILAGLGGGITPISKASDIENKKIKH